MPRRSLPLVLLLALAACPAEEPSAPAPTPGGGGSGGGGEQPCADLAATGDCRYEAAGVTCGADEVCALAPARSCGDERCCTLPYACVPAVGRRPGGFSCTDDGECESGSCVTIAGGGGVCLRACTATEGCPDGLTCAVVSLDAQRSARTCVGSDGQGGFDVARTLCRAASDCAEGRRCFVAEGRRFYDGLSYGICEPGADPTSAFSVACEANGPLDEGEGSSSSLPYRSTIWSDGCGETGLCHSACAELDPDACNCRQPEDQAFCRAARCVAPCRVDADCPSPMVCAAPPENELQQKDPDLQLWICQLPLHREGIDWGCFDETDCCKGSVQHHGRVCCDHNQDSECSTEVPETTHCRVTIDGDRYTSRCGLPRGLGPIGAPCAGHEACESALCGPDGRCTSPCDPGPGDRCEQLLPGTQCCPMPVGDACVPACRTDCDGGPSCTP